jgi:hypothetical protein
MPQRNNRSRSRSSDEPLMSQWADSAKERPLTTAAAAAGAVAAGVFLWSKRNQISDQITRLSDQISDWSEDMRSGNSNRELALTEGPNESSAIESSRATMAGRSSNGSRSANRSASGRPTAKARRTSGRATPQSTTM